MDPSIRKDIASSKVLQSTTTKSMFVTKRYSDFFQQNSCFVYLPQVGIPSHVLLSPAQLEGQEELLEKKVKRRVWILINILYQPTKFDWHMVERW